MNVYAPKCWLGLHDWQYSKDAEGDVVILEKECMWCDAKTFEVPAPDSPESDRTPHS